ncbi:MAG: hypothetical protein KTR32_35375 [Granulosicoccus sp.]|nr:hypothetical protein [Granulosicoccus sp.]
MKQSHLTTILLALSMYSTASVAQMTDYEREKLLSLLQNTAIEQNLDIFDGSAFNPEVDLETGYRYMTGYITQMNKVVHGINGMTSPARSSDHGRQFIAEAQEKLTYSKAMRSAFRDFEKAKKSAPVSKPTSTTTGSTTKTVKTIESEGEVLSPEQLVSVQLHFNALEDLMASGSFDGSAINPTLSWEDAQAYQQQFLSIVNTATDAYNNLPDQAKTSDAGKVLRSELQKHLDIARIVNGALFNHRALLQRRIAETTKKKQIENNQRREQARRKRENQAQLSADAAAAVDAQLQDQRARLAPVCDAFSKEVMTRRNQRRMTAYFQNADAIKSDYKSMSRFLTLAESISTRCAKPDYSALLKTSCSDSQDLDPKSWCETATTARTTMRNHILRETSSWETIAENRYISADKLDRSNGWIPIEGPTSLEKTLSFDRMMYVNNVDFGPEKQRDLFADLDIQPDDFPYYTASLDYIDELREAINEGAASWPAAPRAASGEDTNYGTALAAETITQRWHPTAEIRDSWLSRANWKIIKNNLGVILRRTLPGHVLFKLPDDPYCQIRSFTLTEQYTGSGTFQPAKGVRFGYVRFQSCG